MLQKVSSGSDKRILCFRNIHPDSTGEGICFVRDGQHKFTKADKPFVVLYLQDSDKTVIPGYIFDLQNFQQSGAELTKVTRHIVRIKYRENYLPRYGMTVILDKVEIVENPSQELLNIFVPSATRAKEYYTLLMQALSNKLGLRVTAPMTICTKGYLDYNQGEIGGLCIHYWDMFRVLDTYSEKFSSEEQKQMWGTFLLFIYAHSNYLEAATDGSADITLVARLTAAIEKHAKLLTVSAGVLEVVHIFFGAEPTDIFVRLVTHVSDDIVKATKEINMYRTLPDTREGNAGYGVIRRYASKA